MTYNTQKINKIVHKSYQKTYCFNLPLSNTQCLKIRKPCKLRLIFWFCLLMTHYGYKYKYTYNTLLKSHVRKHNQEIENRTITMTKVNFVLYIFCILYSLFSIPFSILVNFLQIKSRCHETDQRPILFSSFPLLLWM